MAFFKSLATNAARTKQVMMAKIGQSEATVDPQFNQLETQFKEQYNKMKKLTKFVDSYLHAIKDLGAAQAGMAQMIVGQYDQADKMMQVATKMQDESSSAIEQQRDRMEKYYHENFYQPIERYLTQYKAIDERITERGVRLVDMDRYNTEVKALMAKSDTVPTKLQVAKDRAESKRVEYNALNEELINDIQKLISDRSRFFDALFANLVQGQKDYLSGSAQVMNSLQPNFEGINRLSVRAWPTVITDSALSSFRPTSAEGVLASNNQLPPSNKPPTPQQPAGQQFTQQQPIGQQFAQQPQQPIGQQFAQQQPQQSYQSGFPQQQQPAQSQFKAQQAYPVQAQQPISSFAPPVAAAASLSTRARALYPFVGQDDTELTFQPGDVIEVFRQGGEWWEGEFRGRRGLFPSNYVQLV